jgi:hypothetical protein
MALVTCPDCKTEVSDAAPACPKCGRPLVAAPTSATDSRRRGYAAGAFVLGFAATAVALKHAWGPGYAYSTIAGFILVGGVIVGGVCAGLAFMIAKR